MSQPGAAGIQQQVLKFVLASFDGLPAYQSEQSLPPDAP
jgi:hypothetical protein